ncbi:MAG: hypothetical protein CL942_05830 [Desulfovibrio sp.]|nr:hypothetical protein [Desulfovibrio sp.]|tara:strand:+ start:1476 stop:2117 length:642 start_codon:yes stop_codon:yes gene_type:complete
MTITPIDTVTIGDRKYPFYSKATGSMIEIRDGITPYMSYLVQTFPDELNKALGHIGWWMRRRIQDAVYEEDPPGTNWPELSDIQRLRTLDDIKRERLGKRLRAPATHAFGQLVRAIGYKRDKHLMRVRVGWLSKAAASRAARLQAGFSTPVTPKMKRFFAAAGLPIPSGSIKTEGRELIQPVFDATKGEVMQRIEDKVHGYLFKTEKKFKTAA